MQNFFCQMAQNSKFTFKEKYFIYQDRRAGRDPEPEPPTRPAAPGMANAPAAPAEVATRREVEGEGETPKTMFETLKAKVQTLDATLTKVIDNETYTKGLQTQAAKAKTALGSIQAKMKVVDIEKVDMEALKAFQNELTALESSATDFQGEKEAKNTAAKTKITTLRASLDKAAKEEYNGAKLKEALLATFKSKDLPAEITAAIAARINSEDFGKLMEQNLKSWQEMLDSADQKIDPAAISSIASSIERHLPQFTVAYFMNKTPKVQTFMKEINTIVVATALAVVAKIGAAKNISDEDKAKLKAEVYKRAAEAITAKKEFSPATLAVVSAGLPFPLNMLGVITAGGKAAYDKLQPQKKQGAETTEERMVALKQRSEALVMRIKSIADDVEGKIYTKGLIAQAIAARTALTGDKDVAALEKQIKELEGNPLFTAEAIAANKAAKDHIKALTDQTAEKEIAMTPEQVRVDIFAELDIASLPEPLQKALEARFPKDAVTADLAVKLIAIKEALSATDQLDNSVAIESLLTEITKNMADLTVEKYADSEVLKDFNADVNRAKFWHELKDLGGDGEQCKAAKAKALEDLTKAVTENGDFNLDEADNQILAGFVADVVSAKIGQNVTPEQITAKITFRGIATLGKLDKTTKAIFQALNSEELKGKVNFNWVATTNATPHGVEKTLSEHEKMLSGLNEYEEREAKGTVRMDNGNASPELDGEGKPITQPGTLDKELVGEYRELVENARLTKGTKYYGKVMKLLKDFVKENEDTFCAAGGHFDMATAIIRARKGKQLVFGKDAAVDTQNETVSIAITNRPKDVGKSALKSAGLYFSAPASTEPDAELPPAPVAGEPAAPIAGAPAQPELPTDPGPAQPAAPKVGDPGFEDPAPNPDGASADKVDTPPLNEDGASADTFGDEEPPAPEELDPNSPEAQASAAKQAIVNEAEKITTWHTKTENGQKVDYSFEGRAPQEGDLRKIHSADAQDEYDLERFHDGKWDQIMRITKVQWETYPSEGDKAAQPSDSPDDFSAERREIGKVKIWRGDYNESYSSDTAKDHPKDGDLKRVADKAHEGHFHYYRFFMNKWQPMGNFNLYTGMYIAHGAPKPHEKIEKRKFRKTSLKGNEKKQFLAKISAMPEESWLGESGKFQITEVAYTTPQPQAGDLKRIRPIHGAEIDGRVTTYYRYDGNKWKEIAKVDEDYDQNS